MSHLNESSIASPVVIVTGAGRGIGAATAIQLAQAGYAVCVNYRCNRSRADDVVRHIIEHGGRSVAFQADVTQADDVKALFDYAHSQLGPVTHLVNNAGRLFTQSALVDIDEARFDLVFASNVKSCFLCCQQAAQRLPSGGAIVNVSSLAARTGSPFEYVDYAASKGAMDTLTLGLAKELAAKNIRVNGVRPGFIDTEMHADGGEPGRVARLAPQIPMQRGGRADEVAAAIVWLLSDAASYTSGTFIDVAGGR